MPDQRRKCERFGRGRGYREALALAPAEDGPCHRRADRKRDAPAKTVEICGDERRAKRTGEEPIRTERDWENGLGERKRKSSERESN